MSFYVIRDSKGQWGNIDAERLPIMVEHDADVIIRDGVVIKGQADSVPEVTFVARPLFGYSKFVRGASTLSRTSWRMPFALEACNGFYVGAPRDRFVDIVKA